MFASSDVRCLNPNKTLGVDQACLSIVNNYNDSVSVYSFFNECTACENQLWANLSANSNTTLAVSTKWPLHMYYVHDGNQWCHDTFRYVEGGHYGWNLSRESICSSVYTIVEATDPYLPIFAAFMILTIAMLINATTRLLFRIGRGFLSRTVDDQSDVGPLQEPEPAARPVMRITRASTRIQSIDAFRGFTILLMIFVNNGGGEYVFFNHAVWYGLTVADLVFPWFAWIMGLTIVLSLKSDLRLSISRPRIILKCLRRALMLILLGLIINGQKGTKIEELRFPGILQLLGITYFICASIETLGMKTQRNFQYGRFAFLQDILDAWPQWMIVLVMMTGHLLITFLLPVPGCPKGYFGPGGNEYRQHYANCTGGAAGYIDRMIFGRHIYMKTENPVYGKIAPHDPEGLMNTLSAVLIVQFGVQAGRILFCYYLHNSSKILRWFCWAAFLGIIAGFICNWSNYGVIPVSKNMMSISFVLITSSFAFILFALFYYLIDHRRVWSGSPFVYAGTNSILLYMGHYFAMNHFPWAWKLDDPTHATVLAMNLWTTILWGYIAYLLYRKDVIITI